MWKQFNLSLDVRIQKKIWHPIVCWAVHGSGELSFFLYAELGGSNSFQWLLSIIYQEKGGLKIIGCYFLHGSTKPFDAKNW